eukprot:CAMPEP_0175059814 /NCGR_PEP_ID=MMETSP0052_2-20121109/12640_1 /TAXON_ID=51329 ORGANISM="Polytomella parva, Strain SAG 63-3" /NCGR_SAMPLE_ID=MMETSP0052_2 /ASSEMBLY_ACC=CAM_ASM_000194 /LENGTH=163 /DNA_ID=CAMNT_0016325403 /DNA_START=184 /DNA_END=675 /DNA_ORIENTATION=-
MEFALIGLHNAGKSSLVNVLTSGQFQQDMIPTVGFNMKKVTKGGVIMKVWDLGGQPRFRTLWERYCRGGQALVFVVDAADHANIPEAMRELHALLSKPSLKGLPVLVLGNKNDLPEALGTIELVEQMQLRKLKDREVCVYSISCKKQANIDITLEWLSKHAKS